MGRPRTIWSSFQNQKSWCKKYRMSRAMGKSQADNGLCKVPPLQKCSNINVNGKGPKGLVGTARSFSSCWTSTPHCYKNLGGNVVHASFPATNSFLEFFQWEKISRIGLINLQPFFYLVLMGLRNWDAWLIRCKAVPKVFKKQNFSPKCSSAQFEEYHRCQFHVHLIS